MSVRLPTDIEHWPIQDLVPYARNANTHTPKQVDELARSMRIFGWTVPCLVDPDGDLIAGHGRLLAAEQLAQTVVPVIVLGHLTPAERRAYRIADKAITDMSQWDLSLLQAELDSVDLGSVPGLFEEDMARLRASDAGASGLDEVVDAAERAGRERSGATPVMCPECGATFEVG